jgi:hypothetical protein
MLLPLGLYARTLTSKPHTLIHLTNSNPGVG